MEVFRDYAYYYNLIYRDKDYKMEAGAVKFLLDVYASYSVESVLNIGCGTGKHDRELYDLGFQTKGIDLSSQMIEIARENYKNFPAMSFEVGDARNYRTAEKYDAVLSLFHVVSYQNENEDVFQLFQTAYAVLKDGGIFIFDAWYGPGVLTDRPAVRVKEMADEKNTVIRYARPIMYANRNVVDVCYDILVIDKKLGCAKRLEEVHSMRYFFMPEVKFYLEKAGFEFKACLDCSTLEETDYNSWTAYFVAVKR